MSEAATPPLERRDVFQPSGDVWLARMRVVAAAPTQEGRAWPGIPSESDDPDDSGRRSW